MANGITPKQQAFIDAYLGESRGNATDAARRAGYSDAEVSGYQCKRNVAIRARIDEVLAARTLSSQEVLSELTAVAMAPWQDFVQVRTNPRTGEVVDAKIVLADKVKALELLAKYHGLLKEKVEHTGPGGGPVRIQFEAMADTELHERARLVLIDTEDGLLAGDPAPLRIAGGD